MEENYETLTIVESIEEYISYFERIVSCICETCDKQKPEDFNYLHEFLNYIKKNKKHIINNKLLCNKIISILSMTFYLSEGSTIENINNYIILRNQCLGICYKNEYNGQDNLRTKNNYDY